LSSTAATDSGVDCTVVVPVYRNEENIPSLVQRLRDLHAAVPGGIEAVLVVDGSPDRSHALLAEALREVPFAARLMLLSRNFGSFAAIREGLRVGRGRHFAVMAADLQEPAELVVKFFEALSSGRADLVLGTRRSRADPLLARLSSGLFWGAYRRTILPELPAGGVDVFGCTAAFRDELLRFDESHTSLIGQLFWLGFRRETIAYDRQARELGRSAWTWRKKLAYLSDSLFAFSDLPIRAFLALGTLGILGSFLFGLLVLLARLSGAIAVPGYAATVITIVFFAGLNMLGLGIIGSYVWRTYENTKARPLAVVMRDQAFPSTEQT